MSDVDAYSAALEFSSLIGIAYYAETSACVYDIALELGWDENQAESCQALCGTISRNEDGSWNTEDFFSLVDNEWENISNHFCTCECHNGAHKYEDFFNGPKYYECDCCEDNWCFHASHDFNYDCPACNFVAKEETQDESEAIVAEEYYDDDGDSYEEEEPLDPTSRVETIVCRLQKVTDTDYPVRIYNGARPNGYADGSSIGISTGAEQNLDDDEMAWLISHEITHNLKGHSQKKMARASRLVANVGDSFNGKSGFVGSVIVATLRGVAGHAVNRACERNAELVADRTAKTIMAEAGFDPGKSVTAMQKIGGGGGESIFDTHPSTTERMRRLR